MQIQGYSGTQAVNPFDLDTQFRRRTAQEQRAASSGDTVNISPEAMELLAKMQAARREAVQDEANKLDTSTKAGTTEKTDKTGSGKVEGAGSDGSSGTDAAEGSNGGGAAGGGESSGDDQTSEIERLRQQIKQLSGTVQNIMKGPQPVDAKVTQSQPFEAQIQVIEGRIRELEAAAKEQAAAAK